ncbi:NADP-dependent oxidoreductase [Streptomyces sp. NBC_01429]|uniref:NADP-dependent oxidoreductase n=1 Tax=Streptomyces sp. NBC_01429 TaxID=2903862 RepID=UPI002E2B12DE|nr:NADP-dependent oxidoreductase [Streptomyces sp. NBC_01429]
MKALVAPSYGPLDQLVVTDVPKPAPGPGQILVRVETAALNPLDAALVVGAMREMMPVEHPFVVGMDASGVVEAVGEGVTGYAAGDEVLAYTHFHPGTIAEYTLVTEGPDVAPRPAGLDAARAAALVSTSLTGECVLDAVAGETGQTLLVIGATGGVGSFVVQLASRAGLRVLATAAPADAEYVRGLGASEVIDYTAVDTLKEALRLAPDGVDAVVDLISRGPALAGTAAAVKEGGRLVSTLMGPTEFERGVTVTYVRMATRDGRLGALAERVLSGDLSVEVTATYPLSDAPKALAEFAAGRYTRGKVVVTV